MKPTRIYSVDIPANGASRLLVAGDYFKILAATGNVRVDAEWGSLDYLVAGQGLEDTPFSFLLLTDKSGSPNTVRLVIGDERFIDGSLGSVSIGSARAVTTAMASAAPAVGIASAQLVAANTGRQYLLVQNQHATGTIWINPAGGAAVAGAGCIKLGPGGSWEPLAQPTGQVNAIGDVANALVTVITG